MREAEKIWNAFERAVDETSALQARAQSAEAALTTLRTLADTLDAEAADLRQRAKTERDPQIAAQLFGEEFAKADAAGRLRAALGEK